MPLIGTISLTIGVAIVKYMVSDWVGGNVQGQIGQDLLDLARDRMSSWSNSASEQQKIDQMAKQVVQRMTPFLEAESRALDDSARTSVVLAAAQTISATQIDADFVMQHRLDPKRLADALADKHQRTNIGFSDDELTLYHRLLAEISRHITYIANHLIGYSALVDHHLLIGMEQLLENMIQLLAAPDIQAREYERRYCERLRDKLNEFERIGIDYAETSSKQQRLDVAYVSLRMEQIDGYESGRSEASTSTGVRMRVEVQGVERESFMSRTVSSIQEALALTPRLVIRGQPGSGKSTLLRWLAIQAATGDLSHEHPALASWKVCIPFFIQLRSLKGESFPNPRDWPTLQVRMLGIDPPPNWVDELLTQGRALVLIDGVDEVPKQQREAMLECLEELVATYPLARYIITSRPAAIKAWPDWINWSRKAGFQTVSLQEMEQEQVFTFIDQWHEALQDSVQDEHQPTEIQDLAQALKQLLRQRLPLRRLARNPLLCTMICALHRDHPRNMPQNRIKLYQDCVEMLMYKRDAERGVGSLDDYPPLGSTHEEVVLRDYAHHLMLDGESEEDVEDAINYFDGILQNMNMPGWTGEKLRDYFVARTGLLTDPAEGRIAFAHRTFQEFLAARVIAQKNEIGMLIGKAREDQWRETILLTVGLPEITQRQNDRLMRGLLKKADELTTVRYRHELYLLAVACLEAITWLTSDLRQQVVVKAATLIPPRDDDAIALLAKGGDPLVSLLHLNPRHSFAKMARCVHTLAAISSEPALEAIAAYAASIFYAHDDAFVLRKAIGAGLFYFDLTQYCRRVLRQVYTVDLSNTRVRDAGLEHLRGLNQLQTLNLSNTQVSDAGLKHLQGLSGLQSVYLIDTQVSGAGLMHLQGLNQLQSLHLSGTQVSDAGLEYLQGLNQLRLLYLSGTQVSDAGLAYRRGLNGLQSLYLMDTHVSDVGLAYLRGLNGLQSLYLSATRVSDAGLEHLQGLNQLQSLYLIGTQVSDAGLAHLRGLSELQSLSLIGTQVSDAGLVYLRGLSGLQSLYLMDTQVSGAGLEHLRGLNQLRLLYLTNTQVGDAGLMHLQGLNQLQTLNLSNTQVRDAGLEHLQGLNQLQTLNLSNTQVSDAGLMHLQGLNQLQSLYLSGTQVSDAGLEYLQGLNGLQSLTLMNTRVGNKGLEYLQGLCGLLSLDLEGTQVSDAGLIHLQRLSQMQSLDLTKTQVSDVSVLDHHLGLDIRL